MKMGISMAITSSLDKKNRSNTKATKIQFMVIFE